MKIIKKQYTHYVSDNVEVNLNATEQYNVHVVYFINCLMNSNYLDWLYNQIPLVEYGCPIYIVATIDKKQEKMFRQIIRTYFPTVHVECYYVNEHEYPGILKVWELAQKHNKRNDIILYFHSKGVTRHPNYSMNRNDNYNIILKDLNKIKEILTIFPKIDKIGYSCSYKGLIWYNFWFVRGSYAYMVEKPVKTENRYYYEEWLSKKVEDKKKHNNIERPFSYYRYTANSCYGFHTNGKTILNIGSWYDPRTNRYKQLPY
jgi:hypothetical protein